MRTQFGIKQAEGTPRWFEWQNPTTSSRGAAERRLEAWPAGLMVRDARRRAPHREVLAWLTLSVR